MVHSHSIRQAWYQELLVVAWIRVMVTSTIKLYNWALTPPHPTQSFTFNRALRTHGRQDDGVLDPTYLYGWKRPYVPRAELMVQLVTSCKSHAIMVEALLVVLLIFNSKMNSMGLWGRKDLPPSRSILQTGWPILFSRGCARVRDDG